ncbi:PREDICTED: uncharacterized protein LOC109581706 isoform X2 [Amphimedon queenslandica]|uniref:Fibronectin type-III domain-containing protein n=1 Tax=Amphimedon queenslandica TaxID=400682 RepID=A0A1X7UYH5_AMPQE|nr:PREDICTED: uncharacterized protein LOC109581706 isoform X2 [Amphimedon queenslandica]|eukprot:XP_019851604.1 PREDICTED: uncharacterized protein LOC109581706 isoform X2 [Amphimedon queenslandica]
MGYLQFIGLLLLLLQRACPQPPLITGLPVEPVCSSKESIVLNCTTSSEPLQTFWKINEFGVDFVFAPDGMTVGSTNSRFVGTLVSATSDLTISTLTFAANASFNGVEVECIDGSTLPSTVSSITINFTLATLPGPPVNASVASLNCSSLIVKWDPPNDTGGVEGISYELMVSLNDTLIKELSNITDTYITLTDLDYETEYNISIIAANCVGRGEPAFITPTITIEPPSNLTASVLDCSSLNVTWTRPALEFDEAISFDITISPPPPSLITSPYFTEGVCTTDEEFLIVTGLDLYSLGYTVNISSSICSGDAYSSYATIQQEPLSSVISLGPLNVSFLSCDTMFLSWSESRVYSEYGVTVSSSDGYSLNTSTPLPYINVTGLVYGATYAVSVYAEGCKESMISRDIISRDFSLCDSDMSSSLSVTSSSLVAFPTVSVDSVSSLSYNTAFSPLTSVISTPTATHEPFSNTFPSYFWAIIVTGFILIALVGVLIVLTLRFTIKKRQLVKEMIQINPEPKSKVHLLSAKSDAVSPTDSIAAPPQSFSTQQSSIPLSTLTSSSNNGSPVLTKSETVA